MTNLKKKIMSIEADRAHYDEAMKLVLSDVGILSRILKSFVPEYKNCKLKDIEEKYIETRSMLLSKAGVADVYIKKDNLLQYASIDMQNTEDKGLNEADIYYDILFRAKYPGEDGAEIGLYINIEAQNSSYHGYPLEMRTVYYGARLLSSQLKSINKNTNYGSLKKVYSIWLCIGDIPKAEASKVSLYRFTKHDIIKENIDDKGSRSHKDKEYYDLINIIMIKINERIEPKEKTLRLLMKLFSSCTTKMEKINVLEENGISLKEEGGLEYMCNLSENVWRNGIIQGQTEGRNVIIVNMLKNGVSAEDAALYAMTTKEDVLSIADKNGIKLC